MQKKRYSSASVVIHGRAAIKEKEEKAIREEKKASREGKKGKES
jgi:hypothetical protein